MHHRLPSSTRSCLIYGKWLTNDKVLKILHDKGICLHPGVLQWGICSRQWPGGIARAHLATSIQLRFPAVRISDRAAAVLSGSGSGSASLVSRLSTETEQALLLLLTPLLRWVLIQSLTAWSPWSRVSSEMSSISPKTSYISEASSLS